ncbi:MAG TPA: hypothetical protein VFX70_21290 [Mycobacteriales bacterium]|nr:hypothetical protein [Mycobacteriales bacterium]
MTSVDEQEDHAVEVPEVPAGESGRPGGRRRRLRLRRPVSLALAGLFFFGPAGAYAAGVRASAIENHPLRAFPGLSAGWKFFARTSAWSIDHLPLRSESVRANVALNERVFGQPPVYGSGDSGPVNAPTQPAPAGRRGGVTYPKVIQGSDGWLYFGGDVTGACNPRLPVSEVLSRLNRLAAAIDRSGRTFVFTVAPDKSTVLPQHLPASYLGERCARARKAQFWSALRSDPPAGYFDLRGPIEAEQKRTGQPAYWKDDTHWGQYAAATYAERLAGRVDPTVFGTPPAIACGGTATRRGDLAAILGRPRTDTMPGCQIQTAPRPVTGTLPTVGSSRVPDFTGTPVHVGDRYTAAGRPVVHARTVLLGDSFSSTSRQFLFPLFDNLTLLHNQTSSVSPARVADAIVHSSVAAFEIVERTVAGGTGSFLDERTVRAVEKAVRAHPLRH